MSDPTPEEVVDGDEIDNEDFESINCMIKEAGESGVLVEVIWSFAQEMRTANSISAACDAALWEWDV